jgi:hypothetical protein
VVKILAVSYSFLPLLAVYVCLLFYDLSSIIGYIGLVGIFWRAGSRTYWHVCVFAVWGAGPVRVYFGRFAGLGGGPVRVSCLFGFVLACVCVIEQVGGWRGSTIILVFSVLFWRVGTIEMVGGAVFKFSLSSVCC